MKFSHIGVQSDNSIDLRLSVQLSMVVVVVFENTGDEVSGLVFAKK